ncbi:hypothetical protein K0M31_001876 [Melipona bicolor]|uniref:Uncharacterized protein n=1 Tax=Melipona bicolor TaxID=60889 RepID=A0AA40GH71_9HYME|nr:hypothetical protein K0M31_001876 [Melipona bicolor]
MRGNSRPGKSHANDRSYSDKQIRCYRCNRPRYIQQYCRLEKIHFRRGDSSHLVARQTSLEDKADYFSFSVEVMAMHTQKQHSSNGCINGYWTASVHTM